MDSNAAGQSKNANAVLADLLGGLALDPTAAQSQVRIVGDDFPQVSPHRLASACAAALGAQAVGVASLWHLRTGRGQQISIGTANALQALRCFMYSRQNGYVLPFETSPLSQYHLSKDDRWIYIMGHRSSGHFLDPALDLLRCPNTASAIAASVRQWDAFALEEALAQRGVPAAVVRTDSEWAAHPQGQWLASRPVIEIEKIGSSETQPLPAGPRPLSGVRVLDVSHVIAGPMVARSLAEHGADVLHISAPGNREQLFTVVDGGWGKRAAFLDLARPGDADRLRDLAGNADVFVQSFRPGALDRKGFSAHELAAIRPGIVHVSISCFGTDGPWASRGGNDFVGQAVSGVAHGEAFGEKPRAPRTTTINDYLAAYLGAAGALAALVLRWRNGGSYRVSVSLAGTSMWLRSLGSLSEAAQFAAMPYQEPVEPELMQMKSPFGIVTALKPVTRFSETPPHWELPPEPLGASLPEWTRSA
jgi:crotonobetainyl-CoA:carnitine CoA-transferase CaiB-like acyl-CoA transferase